MRDDQPGGQLPLQIEQGAALRERIVGQTIRTAWRWRCEDPDNALVWTDYVVIELISGSSVWLPDYRVDGEPAMYLATRIEADGVKWIESREIENVDITGKVVTEIVQMRSASSGGLVLDDHDVLYMDVSGFRVVPFCRPKDGMDWRDLMAM